MSAAVCLGQGRAADRPRRDGRGPGLRCRRMSWLGNVWRPETPELVPPRWLYLPWPHQSRVEPSLLSESPYRYQIAFSSLCLCFIHARTTVSQTRSGVEAPPHAPCLALSTADEFPLQDSLISYLDPSALFIFRVSFSFVL